MGKILDKIVQDDAAPSRSDLWLDGETLKANIHGKWKSISGGGSGAGVTIVDSVDKLDENAPVGSMAVLVDEGKINKVGPSELIQPTSDVINMETYEINTDGLSLCVGIEINIPTSPILIENSYPELPLIFCTKNMNLMDGDSGVGVSFKFEISDNYINALECQYVNMTAMKSETLPIFGFDSDKKLIVYNENIDKLNTYFKQDELYYVGDLSAIMQGGAINENVYDVIDPIIKVFEGTPSDATICLKKDSWEFYLKDDIKKILLDIENLSNNKQNIIKVTSTDRNYVVAKPNELIISQAWYSPWEIRLNVPNDDNYNEYLIQLEYSGNSAVDGGEISIVNNSGSEPIDIKWANSIAPVLLKDHTYMISIVNNLGVWAEF